MATLKLFLILLSLICLSSVAAVSQIPPGYSNNPFVPHSRSGCQRSSSQPLSKCPRGTILVSATHSDAHFTNITSALQSLPDDNSTQIILILAGNYTGKLNITRPGPVYLLGQTINPFNSTTNLVNVIAADANYGQYSDNTYTSVLNVAPTLNASLTGSGPTGFNVSADTPFGCSDFRTYNIDFHNVYSLQSNGPSLALGLSRANGGFYYSGFYSYQDTIYVGKLGNAYFYGSIIAGQTDFLYGFGTAYINQSTLLLRGCGGGITAWKGTNTTFANKYGVYITESTVRKTNSSLSITNKCSLGRPWNSQHRSIFAGCNLDDSIISAGYTDWLSNGTSRITPLTFMAEYRDFGLGFNLTGRIEGGIDKLLDATEFAPYSSLDSVFQTTDGVFKNTKWIDRIGL